MTAVSPASVDLNKVRVLNRSCTRRCWISPQVYVSRLDRELMRVSESNITNVFRLRRISLPSRSSYMHGIPGVRQVSSPLSVHTVQARLPYCNLLVQRCSFCHDH